MNTHPNQEQIEAELIATCVDRVRVTNEKLRKKNAGLREMLKDFRNVLEGMIEDLDIKLEEAE